MAAALADPETLEAISLNDREFYGTASDEESFVSHTTARDSDDEHEDEHLSPSEDEEAIERAARGLAGASASQESSQDDEISAQIAGGCGCSEEQFSPQEILDFKLSMRELSKGERDLFLMGKLQVCIRLSLMPDHERQLKSNE